MYEVIVHRGRYLIEVRLIGVVTREDAIWSGEETRAAVLTFGDAVGRHVTLYDGTDATAVSSDAVDLARAAFANPAVRGLWARKVAFVATNATGRMQVQRIRQSRPDIGLFEDRPAALDWLLE